MGECKVIHIGCCAVCSVTSCEHFLKLRSEVLCTVHSSELGRNDISYMLGIGKKGSESKST